MNRIDAFDGITPPSRQDPESFAARGDSVMGAFPLFAQQANALADEVNALADEVAAAESLATSSKNIALAAANYVGLWSSLSGSLNIPASVYHAGGLWMLTQNLANVATAVPGVAPEWISLPSTADLGTAALADVGDFDPAGAAAAALAEAEAEIAAIPGVAAQTHAATSKATLVDADELPLADSAAAFALKKLTLGNLKAGIWTALGGLIGAGTSKATPVNGDYLPIMDSAASNATKSLSWENLRATLKTYFDTLYATTSSVLTLFNALGSAPVYACRAWVNFDGTGTVAIRASGNVSSITDNGTGDYTVNFTTALPDANYAISAAFGNGSLSGGYSMNAPFGNPTVAGCRIAVTTVASTPQLVDAVYVNVAIFR